MDTKKFRTRTEQIVRSNVSVPDTWEIAIDVGYSAVKIFSNNIVAAFPSYAKRIDEDFEFVTFTPPEAILYRNLDTNEQWLVGAVAQERMDAEDTSDSESSLYGRKRYSDEMFKVFVETGLGVGMQDNQHGRRKESDKIVIQTGLPEKYMNDAPYLKDVFEGRHHFALKIGAGKWKIFDFTIVRDDVYVMSQPRGSFFSICFANNGSMIKEARAYQNSNIIIFDPGFGTLDIFTIVAGAPKSSETFADLGMKRILQDTAKAIKENFDVEISVPAMQKYLETGEVIYEDERNFISKKYSFEHLLENATKTVCEEAINKLRSSVSGFKDYDYLVVTGGTGSAWYDYIVDKFKGYSDLKVVKGNQNDSLSFIYSNVRGYYFVRYNALKKEVR